MKQLWAPWRAEYIGADKNGGGCIFCDAVKKDPKEGLVLFNGSVSTAMLNRYPYNSGHIMVCPIRHVSRLEELTPEESLDSFRLLRAATAALSKAMNAEGFNVGMNIGKAAGAGVEGHMHMHIVPRWNGDVNFMPVLSEVKVISAHLLQTYEMLKPYFERI